jgi:hypothetical protein
MSTFDFFKGETTDASFPEQTTLPPLHNGRRHQVQIEQNLFSSSPTLHQNKQECLLEFKLLLANLMFAGNSLTSLTRKC